MAIQDDVRRFIDEWRDASATVEVQTSGSTGRPKRLRVEKERMRASARMTCRALGLRRGDTALLCMPMQYIAGKMMVVRALEWGLHLIIIEPSGHPLAAPPTPQGGEGVSAEGPLAFTPSPLWGVGGASFAAMVPLQVYNSLGVPEERERLRQIRHLIIGGGAIDAALEDALRDFPNPVYSTYGMTETLSHIALRRVGGDGWYTPLEGIHVETDAERRLVIDAPTLCPTRLVTNDLAEVRDGRFRILGRRDNTICSGGIKIQIEDVEALLPAGCMITAERDERLGERVVMITESATASLTGSAGLIPATASSVCSRAVAGIKPALPVRLPPYWRPRRIIRVARLPLTATGKPDRARARAIAALADPYVRIEKCSEGGGALARRLLADMLLERFGIDDMGEWDYGPHGKPSLRRYPWAYFNISHCREGVAVAVSERPVGIDIETIRPRREAVLRYVLNDEERAAVRSDADFIRLWTRKEALVKLTGRGINDNMKDLLTNTTAHLTTTDYERFIVTVATH